MSTQYPVLDNRPIDQWKVTELKDELRRRKLPVKGLKEELVRRLGEAILSERETMSAVELNTGLGLNSNSQGSCNEEEAAPLPDGKSEVVQVKIDEKADNDSTMVNQDYGNVDVNQSTEVQDGNAIQVTSFDGTVEEGTVNMVSMEDNVADSQSLVTQLDSSSEDPRSNEKNEDFKAPIADAALNPSQANNQVSEVSPDLGFQVSYESISTDSVSINEKNELKDNLNADNFHLELDVVKPEMVQPSSSDVPPISGDEHPLDDDKEHCENQVSLEEIDATCAADVDLSKKNDSGDGGSPEKLNLDRSSGDESLEEDVLESKHMDSSINEVEEKSEISKVHAVEERPVVDFVVDDLAPDKKDIVAEEEMKPAASTEKRKLEDDQALRVNEAPKRQRRWNSEKTIKVPEVQTPILTASSTPKDTLQPTPRRTFTRSDSGLSGDSPKERIVPPSQKAATSSLRIDRFLRPFTLKAVQELLAKTGSVCNFWMDHIKTHCYVTYSSVEEAIATRNALYNLKWPPNGGKLLVADFVDPQEVKMRVEASPQSPAPVAPSPTTPTAPSFQHQQAPQSSPRLQQQPPPPPSLVPPPPLHNPLPIKERLPPPPPPLKKPELPVVTLDDLFKKTKATPRIYYLPLSEEQVATKIAAQGKSIKE